MRSSRFYGKIRPKVSSMPRPKSEATAYLDLYKLAVEKKRLLQELQTLEQRRHVVHQRLSQLNSKIADLEENVQQQRPILPEATTKPQLNPQEKDKDPDNFSTLFLDY